MTAVPRPTGVAILGILGFIGSFLTIITGIGGLVLSAFISDILTSLGAGSLGSQIVGAIVALFSVGVLIVGLIYLLLSWGLWSGKNWARIIWILFSILGALGALGVLVGGAVGFIVPLVIDILIIYYLTRPHVAAYFKHMVMMPPTAPPVSK